MRKIKIVARHSGEAVPHLDYYRTTPIIRRWLPLGEVVEVDYMPEWISEIRAGVVIAADVATAKLANIDFSQAAVDEALAPAAAVPAAVPAGDAPPVAAPPAGPEPKPSRAKPAPAAQ